ncbi:polygalacturonase inhibitor-like [Abrus precatorius]|uniref:Polygalacturonase inhibitor-like n=1 Tax=Abrus precatorius TaxID=3816 RepID=A0A8B8MB80_ABRPR|nr:polygalacturonase inhibitor-like [Abrus precatorius]
MSKAITPILLLLFTLLSHTTPSLSERCHPEDKKALLQIKEELNNPTLLSSWKPDADCCHLSWYGVGCYADHNRVDSLTIQHSDDIVAQFPPSIGNLPYLESLYISSFPYLTGPIPQSVSKLTNLKFVTITFTNVSGPVPNFWPSSKGLVNLDLSFNSFSGTLPPSLNKFLNLSWIYFNDNKLTGPIPYSYGFFNDKNPPDLYFSNNQLSGSLPLSLARLNSSLFDFSNNRFKGDASMLFGSNKATTSIDLSRNMFSFDFGKVELSKTMISLYVNNNQIYGNLPVGIENIFSLNVSYNRLCGEIPKGGYMKRFHVSTFFHNKCLCGSPLPPCK